MANPFDFLNWLKPSKENEKQKQVQKVINSFPSASKSPAASTFKNTNLGLSMITPEPKGFSKINSSSKPQEKKSSPKPTPAPKKQNADTYKVVKGDYLIKIADKLGVDDWHDIYKANKDVIGKNPDLIYPDQEFKIPRKTAQKTDQPKKDSTHDFGWIDDYQFPSQKNGGFIDNIKQKKAQGNQHDSSWIMDYVPPSQREPETKIPMTANEQMRRATAQKNQAAMDKRVSDIDKKLIKAGLPKSSELPKGLSADFAVKNPGFTKFMMKVTKPIKDTLEDTAPGKFITRTGQTGGDIATAGASSIGRGQKATTGNKAADVVADVLGMVAGTVANPGGAPSLGQVMGKSGQTFGQGFEKAAQNLQPSFMKTIGKKTVEGTGAGLPFALSNQANDAMYTDKTLGQRAGEVALESALFGLGDGALYGAGKAIGKGLQATGLPQKMALAKELNNAQPLQKNPLDELLNRPAVINEAKPIQETVLESVVKPNQGPLSQGKFRVVNPASRQLDELFAIGKEIGLPPGREYETLQGIWSSIAPREAGTLDDLIQAATKEMGIDDMLQAGAKNMQQMKDAQKYGIYQPLKFGQLDTKQTTREIDPYPTFQGNQAAFNLPGNQQTKPINIDDVMPGKTTRATMNNPQPLPQEINDLLDGIFGASKQAAPAKAAETKVSGFSAMSDDQFNNLLRTTNPNTVDDVTYQAIQAERMRRATVKPETFATNMNAAQEPKTAPPKGNPVQNIDAFSMRDINGPDLFTNDVYRNFKKAFGDQYPAVKESILDPFDASKKARVDMQKQWTNKLKTEVVDKLGIKKDTKLSALVQQYGEKEITLEQLKKSAPKDWQKVVEADQWFRAAYDGILDQVNAVRAKIYPNNPEKLVPKRQDYYRHFQEFTDLTGLKNIFDTPAQIDPKLVGISDFTLPKSKFQGFMQKRGLGPFKRDAVGGFLEYLPGASYAVHIDPHIDVFKGLAKNLANQTEKSKHLNGFIEFLQKYSQDLAGKTNPIDRVPQSLMGRKLFTVLNWLNSRVKSNVILGNASSTLAQLANIPNGVSFAKHHSVPGAARTMASFVDKNAPIKQSGFIAERFERGLYRPFDQKLLDQPKKFAEWIMETADRVGTSFVWNSVYQKGLAQRVADPVKYADDETRRLIAGRGVGEVPLAQKAKVVQMIMPFTLEVANLWKVQAEFLKAKDVGGLAVLFIANHLLNKGMEEVRGSGVTFDPIQAALEASEDGLSLAQRGGRVAGEVLSNLPLGSSLGTLYPEYGMDVAGVEFPTRKELFGDNDPTRFGTGPLVARAIQDPLSTLLPNWGGNQLKKSIGGYNAVQDQAVFTSGGDKLMYPVETDPLKTIQMLLFGPYSTDEARQYFDENRRPLSEKQTEQFLRSGNKQFYNNLMERREIDSLKREMNQVKKTKELSEAEKRKKLEQLMNELRNVRAQ